MGVGGAIMWPAVLGMTYAILPAAKKGLAGGLILGVAGLGNAVGPLLGGLLTDVVSWRLVFFINLPITAFAMFVTVARGPGERRSTGAERGHRLPGHRAPVGRGGGASCSRSTWAATAGSASPLILGLLAAGLALLVAFFVVERRQGGRARWCRATCCATGCSRPACVHGAADVGDLLLRAALPAAVHREGARRSPRCASGAGLLPLMGVFAVDVVRGRAAVRPAGPEARRLGGRGVPGGRASSCCPLLDRGSSYGSLVPGMIVLGIGVGLFYSSITTAAVTALDPSRSSLAGGIVYMCQIAGGAIGLGLNTAIVLCAATLRHGITVAFRVDAALAVIGFVVALAFVRGPRGPAGHADAPPAHHRVRA